MKTYFEIQTMQFCFINISKHNFFVKEKKKLQPDNGTSTNSFELL